MAEESRECEAMLLTNDLLPVNASSSITTPNVDFEEISLKEKVGHGSYGVVYRAMWRGRPVAVKEFGASAEQKAIETEVKQLSRVSHPNIIALYGISSDQQAKYLIMEYAEGGSLHNFLHGKVQPAYTLAHAMSWARQCAEGVAYLHAMTPKPLIHRDLKPLNLLLTNKGRHLKICDFGTVADKSTMMTNNRGSAAWMAPEVFEGSKYTEKCDIFSWAIVLWEVLSRKQPFKEIDNTYSIMWKIHKGERPPLLHNCPERIEELMTSCWKTAPEERPSMLYVVSVMNEIAAPYQGAEKPLEYIFVNQQILTKDTSTTDDEQLRSGFYISDNSSTKSTQETHDMMFSNLQTNITTNTSGASTPTNVVPGGSGDNGVNDDNVTSTKASAAVAAPGDGLFQTHAHASNVPQASIISSNRWEAIPEEETEASSFHTPDSTTTYDSFKLTPSAEAAKRFDTIRNVMIQSARKPLSPLTLDLDANAFDLSSTDSGSNLAKSDGNERLTVTDAKIIQPQVITTTTPYKRQKQHQQQPQQHQHSTMSDMTNNNNNNNSNYNHTNRNANSNNNNRIGDENDDTDQSLTEILDAELQPEPPIPNNLESQSIYREHRRLAKEYLSIETDLYYAQDLKEKLILQMDVMERKQKQELLLKMKEKDDLTSFYNNLKQQLEKMRADEAILDMNGGGNHSHPHPNSQHQHHQYQHNTTTPTTSGTTTVNDPTSNMMVPNSASANSELLSEDGWVVIAPNQNT